ncbi:MAG: aminotransferase class V-fold PLP-dependent enzyme [Puniceicoccales bacterium]|jgi:cysteine desulfurase|nr:aminotransferase class V-fold PLP-dependent enzyme [Puniceicoccales bacterium]
MRYFDANATAPLRPEARDAWLATQRDFWQNPASLSAAGVRARDALEDCRSRLASRFGGAAEMEIVFTGGATEANNAVLAFEAARLAAGETAAISALEHASVREPAKKFFAAKLRVFACRAGAADFALGDGDGAPPVFLSLMAVNNETGSILPVRALRAQTAAAGSRLHCDATQAFGKLPPAQLAALLHGCDYVTGAAHKFGGPKGVGFVAFSKRSCPSFAGQLGGGQENFRRAGTVNLPAIAAMLAALDAAEAEIAAPAFAERAAGRDFFEREVLREISGASVNGADFPRVWNTVSLTLPRHDNIRWLKRLEKHGFAAAAGSACSALDGGRPSPVLQALGLSPAEARRTVRVSAYWETTREDWRALAQTFAEVSHELA